MPPAFARLLLVLVLSAWLIPAAFAQSSPVGATDSYAVGRGGTLVISAPGVLFNDSDPDGDAISVASIFTMPAHGLLSFNANGSFTYAHSGNAAVADSFIYVLADTDPATPNVTVTVNLAIVPADVVAPVVTSLTVPPAGNYVAGQHLDFIVHFDENVFVDCASLLYFRLGHDGAALSHGGGGRPARPERHCAGPGHRTQRRHDP